MKYIIKDGKLVHSKRLTSDETANDIIDIITKEEYLHHSQYNKKNLSYKVLSALLKEDIEYCKVEVLMGCATGTFSVPSESFLDNALSIKRRGTGRESAIGRAELNAPAFDHDIPFGFYMDCGSLLFIEDGSLIKDAIAYISQLQETAYTSVGGVFLQIVDYLLKDETYILQKYEKQLSKLEEILLHDVTDDFDKDMLKIRKDLLTLQAYYQQLTGMFDIFEDNEGQIFKKEDEKLFMRLAKKIDRLYAHISLLKEYSIELWELYKAQIDVKQNQVMKYLTVVATIFMPLTLLTGWYGMNFDNMPELVSKHGYLIITIVSIVIIIVEIWWFKRKKWFD
jgi:magnesium transporter